MHILRSLTTQAVAVNIAAVVICMLLLIASASRYLSDRLEENFEVNSSLFTSFLSNQINTGTRLKRGAMIEPQIMAALSTGGLTIERIRVVHTDGTLVVDSAREGAPSTNAPALPSPDFESALSTGPVAAELLVRTPIVLGAGTNAIVVGELAVVWNRSSL